MGPPKASNCCLSVVEWHLGCAQTALAVFHPLQVKNGKFCKNIFDIVTTYNDEIRHVKHVLDPLCVNMGEYPCLTWRTGGRARRRHSLDRLVPLFRRAPQAGGNQPGGKAQNSEIGPLPPAPRPLYIGSWTVKAQYPLCVFFTLFGCGGGGLPRGVGHTTCLCSFLASAAQKWKFLKLIFSIL